MTIKNVPKEIREVKQWSVSYSPLELKRPLHTGYTPDGALTAEQADVLASSGNLYRGFYVTEHDPYVLIDIDHVDNPDDPWNDLPDTISSFMLARETYWEASPSGKGLRGVLKLPSSEVKLELQTKRALLKSGDGTSAEAEIHFGAPWMTITGNETPYSVQKIATISLEELGEVFNISGGTQEAMPIANVIPSSLPSMIVIQQALLAIPLDKNPRIRRAYENVFNQEYHHYDFWMKILMAVHNYAQLADKNVECLSLVTEWSRDDEAFKSDDDVFKHWISFSETTDIHITYKTLMKLQHTATLVWPKPKKQSQAEIDAGISRKPNISAYENFEAVIKFYNIEFYRDELSAGTMFEVYITGDDDILGGEFSTYAGRLNFGKYYGPFNRETLIPCFNVLLTRLGFMSLPHAKTKEFLKNELSRNKKTINFVKEYIDTPLELLPSEYQENMNNIAASSLTDLFDCLTIEFITDDHERELKLYRKYYLAWLLGLMRNLYYNDGKPNVNNCVLVLTGIEQIRKTSHFKCLFPVFMREKYIAFTPHGFSNSASMRDLAKIAVSKLVVVWDEVEQFLNPSTESNFKKIIDNNPQTFVDKYEVHEKTISPVAIYGATSNQREFKLGDTGSRRMFIIPIAWVDTDRMMSLCWHPIFHELLQLHRMAVEKGSQPWLLTEEELEFQYQCHVKVKSSTDYDMLFTEMFDTSVKILYASGSIQGIKGIVSVQNDKSGRLFTTREIHNLIAQYDSSINIKRPILKHALERFCGDYTGTSRKSRTLSRPVGVIEKGCLKQGIHKKWIFPPLTEEARKELYVFETT